ncbi:MAG: sulfatase [Myxococcaceae bacterium]|nr:sulfatase [Myxococcaceae bacterium]
MKKGGRALAAGALFGLILFAVESALVLQRGAIGLNIETEGPFAALLASVRPLLPGLLARVALAYALGGAALGLVAVSLGALILSSESGRLKWAGLFAIEWAVLAAGLSWLKAIERPALFDDLSWFRPILGWLVLHGEPWHPGLFLGGWAAGHAVSWLRRPRVSRSKLRWSRLVPVVGVLALGSFAVTTLKGRGPLSPLYVLIGVDAFRPDRLVSYGGKGTVAPHLDAFARDATTFDRAFTPLAQTEPAWRSLLTARWPPATGVRYPLTAESRWVELPTFTAALERAGVHTSWATDCSRFNHQGPPSGFAERVQPPKGALNFALEKMRFRALGVVADNRLGSLLVPEFIDNRALAGIHDPVGYSRRLADRLVAAAGEGPALFAFHATAAHFPGDPVYPYYRRFVRADAPLDRKLRMQFTPIAAGAPPAAAAQWTRADSEALYDELLAQADAQVGVLLRALKDAGRYDEATIIVFSDHGESFHPDFEPLGGATPVHGARLREEENRIVLMVKPPHARRIERVSALVRLIDVGPTILELANLPQLPASDGRSLGPLLDGRSDAPRLLYAETGYTHASPVAFDPTHAAAAPRTFAAYEVRPDGVVQMSTAAHEGVLKEKDIGAFDGQHWLVRSPRADGRVEEKCEGNCAALAAFLDSNGAPRR